MVSYSATDVQIEVTDDATGTTRHGDAHDGGNGLRGMYERAKLLGGWFGGFVVRAVLPRGGQQP